ncbi:MAG: Ig-like domain-containing protein [Thermoplasmata archaeon]
MDKGKLTVLLIAILLFCQTLVVVEIGRSQVEEEKILRVELTDPERGDVWSGNNSQNISWEIESTLLNSSINVSLSYVYNGTGPFDITGGLNGSVRNHTWNVPVLNCTDVRLIIQAEGEGLKAWDDVSFSVDSSIPEIVSYYPMDNETMPLDDKIVISFSEPIDRDGFEQNFTLSSDTADINGTWDWKKQEGYLVAEFTPNATLELDVEYVYTIIGNVVDKSDPGNVLDVNKSVTFTAVTPIPTVYISNPESGQQLRIGDTYQINWTCAGDHLVENPVNIRYSFDQGNSWRYIARNMGRNGTYNWTVPFNTLVDYPLYDAIVNVSCENQYGYVGYSTLDYIDIFQNVPPKIQIYFPNRGRNLFIGNEYTVRWWTQDDKTLPNETIMITLSRDGGKSWEILTKNEFNDGRWEWEVKGSITNNAILNVSVTDIDGKKSTALSPSFKIIRESPILIQINNTERTFSSGDEVKVRWQLTRQVEDLNSFWILFTDDGRHWELMDEVETTETSYNLSAPPTLSSDCRVMIRGRGPHGTIFEDTSDEFEIFPDIINSGVEKQSGYHRIFVVFNGEVEKDIMVRAFKLEKWGKEVEIDRSDIYWINDTSMVYVTSDLNDGNYRVLLNSSKVRNRDFDEKVILEFKEGKPELEIFFWALLLIIPVVLIIFYYYRGKKKRPSKISRDMIELEI